MPRSMVAIQSETPPTPPGYDYAGRRTSSWLVSNNSGTEGRIYWDGAQIAYRSNDGTTYFDHKDWIGTERMRTNSTGAVASSYVSLPWGDGYTATVLQSGGDQDSLHFGQLDHDAESSTEHAQFRQYSSIQGRWMSPDPYGGSYDMTNPQSMNRYAYVLNSPLSYVDPSGLNRMHPCAPFCGGNGSPGSTTDPNFSFSPGGAGGTVWSSALNGQTIIVPAGTINGQFTQTGLSDDGSAIFQFSVINLYSLFYWMSSSSMPSPSSASSGSVAPSNFTKKYLPPGAQSCSAIFNFHAPPGFDLNAIIAAGRAGGANPFAALRAVGHGGTFDFQRSVSGGNTTFYSGYTDASNIAVGAYLYGAGFSNGQASFISNSFANTMSSNAGSPQQSDYRNLGYDLAAAGWNPSCH